jgi:RecB family exonuclease
VGPGTRPSDLLVEERNLFYVACTRARHALTIAFVDALTETGDRPSRFIDDVLARNPDTPLVPAPARTPRLASWDGLVADLRIAVLNPAEDSAVREGAAERLALIATLRTPGGRALVPAADPDHWWGIDAITEGAVPVRDPDAPVSLSGSHLDSLIDCPLHWFLDHEVHAEVSRGSATAFGSVVHAVAEYVAKGDIPADIDEMDALVDDVWSRLHFDARWQSRAERAAARTALERFLIYHLRADRTLLGTEDLLRAQVDVLLPDGRADVVTLSGFVDRIEADDDGRPVAIDLKTMRTPPTDKDVPDHGQLGIYQLLLARDPRAAERARIESIEPESVETVSVDPGPVQPGGAALVQLRVGAPKDEQAPKVQLQPALDISEETTWVEQRLGEAVQIIRDEGFAAHRGSACRYCAFTRVCPTTAEGEQVIPT